MRRRLSNLATGASLIAAMVLSGFWIRGFWARDQVALPMGHRYYVVSVFPHHLYLDSDPAWNGMRGSAQFGLAQYPAVSKYLELRLINRSMGAWSLAMPIWLPLMFALAMPGWWAAKFVQNRRWSGPGVCSICGYDLRATPDRCPECGTVPGGSRGGTVGDV
jgi:hypothetical protein